MDTLTVGQPLTAKEPRVLLDPTLKPGGYRVTLVVSGGRGTSSLRAEARFQVVEAAAPEPGGRRPAVAPAVPFGVAAPAAPVPTRPTMPVGASPQSTPAVAPPATPFGVAPQSPPFTVPPPVAPPTPTAPVDLRPPFTPDVPAPSLAPAGPPKPARPARPVKRPKPPAPG